MADLVTTLLELRDLGVGFASLMEALDLTTPSGRALAGLLAVFAEFEREILRERVRAGLAHARENGKRLGRPPAAALNTKQVRQLFRAGVSKAAIARRLRIGRTSVRRILASEKVADSNVTQLSRKHTMFQQAIRGQSLPKYLSTDNDPLYRFHQWQANLRVLEVTEIKTVPYVPLSHPFIERLIGSIRRECLGQTLFWTTADLESKLPDFQHYF